LNQFDDQIKKVNDIYSNIIQQENNVNLNKEKYKTKFNNCMDHVFSFIEEARLGQVGIRNIKEQYDKIDNYVNKYNLSLKELKNQILLHEKIYDKKIENISKTISENLSTIKENVNIQLSKNINNNNLMIYDNNIIINENKINKENFILENNPNLKLKNIKESITQNVEIKINNKEKNFFSKSKN